jgi:hypothetical protein
MKTRKIRQRVTLAILLGLVAFGGFQLLTRMRHVKAPAAEPSAPAPAAGSTIAETAKPVPPDATVAPATTPAAAPLPVARSAATASVATHPASAAKPAPVPIQLPATPPPPAGEAMTPDREVAATHRMYLAHAPLRTPEVADPDSKGNRQILQSMVTKALNRAGQNSPAISNH